jgi:hypothetical protein
MIPRRNVYLIEIDSHILSYGWFNIWVIDTHAAVLSVFCKMWSAEA